MTITTWLVSSPSHPSRIRDSGNCLSSSVRPRLCLSCTDVLIRIIGYYLTRHPSTSPINASPGTPERPLSDLGLKGYTAYWVAMILRFCRKLLAGAAPIEMTPKKSQSRIGGRTLRARREIGHDSVKDIGKINSVGTQIHFFASILLKAAKR